MVRRIIAGAAVVGALTLGTAGGVAGAATATSTSTAPTTPSTAPTTPSTAPSSGSTATTTPSCADMAQLLKRYHASQQKASARLRKEAAQEKRLRKLGHNKLAGFMEKRAHTARTREKRITARLHQAVRACAGTSGSGSAKNSGPGTGSTSSTVG
jgi:hypothetical protein